MKVTLPEHDNKICDEPHCAESARLRVQGPFAMGYAYLCQVHGEQMVIAMSNILRAKKSASTEIGGAPYRRVQ